MKTLKDFEFTLCKYAAIPTDKQIKYRDCLILPDLNGGMTMLSLHISGDWWITPTDIREYCSNYPEFVDRESDQAIAWAKTLIDQILDNHD